MKKEIRSLGSLITAAECEGCLQDLSVTLPRAGLDRDAIHRQLDLYWGLLRKHGVTRDMMVAAAEAYVMAPRKGKPRYFPDPGELFELCAEDALRRKKSIGALMRALAILDGPAPPQIEQQVAPDIKERLAALNESMKAKNAPPPEPDGPETASRPRVSTARACTDPAELKAAIARRMNQAA